MVIFTTAVWISLFVWTEGAGPVDPDCPHPCYVNGHKFCYPPPCPPPPPTCKHPFTPLGQCCEICDTDCPNGTCNIGDGKVCYPVSCPTPLCKNPVLTKGDCCPHCPDCPHGTCKIGNKEMCYPVPCPLPPCKNPVTTKGDCCPHCPEIDVETDQIEKRAGCTPICEQGGKQYCFHPPCPFPPCANPYTPKGKCCPECPQETTTTIEMTTTKDCTPICEQGGHEYCFHPPCPLPPCVDPVTPPGKCCQECPNGANCMINGTIYPAFQDTVVNGLVCRCTGLGQFGSGKCTSASTVG